MTQREIGQAEQIAAMLLGGHLMPERKNGRTIIGVTTGEDVEEMRQVHAAPPRPNADPKHNPYQYIRRVANDPDYIEYPREVISNMFPGQPVPVGGTYYELVDNHLMESQETMEDAIKAHQSGNYGPTSQYFEDAKLCRDLHLASAIVLYRDEITASRADERVIEQAELRLMQEVVLYHLAARQQYHPVLEAYEEYWKAHLPEAPSHA